MWHLSLLLASRCCLPADLALELFTLAWPFMNSDGLKSISLGSSEGHPHTKCLLQTRSHDFGSQFFRDIADVQARRWRGFTGIRNRLIPLHLGPRRVTQPTTQQLAGISRKVCS